MPGSLIVVHVHARVKPERSTRSARQRSKRARQREGARHRALRRRAGHEDPTRFVLVEVYRTPERARRAQGDRPLPALARHRGADDGRAAHEPQLRQRAPRRRRLVTMRPVTASSSPPRPRSSSAPAASREVGRPRCARWAPARPARHRRERRARRAAARRRSRRRAFAATRLLRRRRAHGRHRARRAAPRRARPAATR